MGSTETTFYTISVYFAAIKKKAYPMVFAGACFADLCGFVLSALAVRLYFQ
jgi:spore maturation protein B